MNHTTTETGTQLAALDYAGHDALVLVGAIADPGDILEVRAIDRDGRVRSTWPTPSLLALLPRMQQANEAGWSFYAGLNPRREAGQRGDASVLMARSVWADFDHTTVTDALVRIRAMGMPVPTITVYSGGGVHAYWRLTEPLAIEFWPTWQKDLAALLGSDPKIFNPERLMRLPGFLNHKYTPPVMAELVDHDPDAVYDLCDLPIPMRAETPEPVFTVRRIIDPSRADDAMRRCLAYVNKMPGAVSGAGGHDATYAVASACNRFGLAQAEAIEVMADYNARCDPPWSDRELEHKVKDAYQRNAGQHGEMMRVERTGRPTFTTTIRRCA